jgi:sarcosine oxidase subunit delta
MQLFECPFCGWRDETEFHYGGDAGKSRPQPAAGTSAGQISADDWAHYLYFHKNLKGRTREIWLHLTCSEFFVMERDSVTHEVIASQPLHNHDGGLR